MKAAERYDELVAVLGNTKRASRRHSGGVVV